MHYLAAWDHDCSRFRGTIKEKCFICWLIINKPQPKQSIQETPLLKGHLPWCRGGPLNRGSTVGKKKNHLFGQTSCVKKIIYFRRKLSRSSAQQGEPKGWTIRSTTDIFRKSQYFDSEVQNTLDCKKVVVFFLFFSKSVFQGERRRREIRFSREKNSYFSGLDPLTVSLSAFTLAPGLSSSQLERSWRLYKYGLFYSLRNIHRS